MKYYRSIVLITVIMIIAVAAGCNISDRSITGPTDGFDKDLVPVIGIPEYTEKFSDIDMFRYPLPTDEIIGEYERYSEYIYSIDGVVITDTDIYYNLSVTYVPDIWTQEYTRKTYMVKCSLGSGNAEVIYEPSDNGSLACTLFADGNLYWVENQYQYYLVDIDDAQISASYSDSGVELNVTWKIMKYDSEDRISVVAESDPDETYLSPLDIDISSGNILWYELTRSGGVTANVLRMSTGERFTVDKELYSADHFGYVTPDIYGDKALFIKEYYPAQMNVYDTDNKSVVRELNADSGIYRAYIINDDTVAWQTSENFGDIYMCDIGNGIPRKIYPTAGTRRLFSDSGKIIIFDSSARECTVMDPVGKTFVRFETDNVDKVYNGYIIYTDQTSVYAVRIDDVMK